MKQQQLLSTYGKSKKNRISLTDTEKRKRKSEDEKQSKARRTREKLIKIHCVCCASVQLINTQK